MRLAHLFDPQAALGTSDVDPLPHQLRTVYEEMLPRHPLRFVLADDPGAGKTMTDPDSSVSRPRARIGRQTSKSARCPPDTRSIRAGPS